MKATDKKDPSAQIFEHAFARRFLDEMSKRYQGEIEEFLNRRDKSENLMDAGLSARPCASPDPNASCDKK